MNEYYNNQLAKMTEWIKLFLIMSSYQKIMLFNNSEGKTIYERTVDEVTFEDLAVFAEYEISDIFAKNNLFVFNVEHSES